MSSAKLLCAVVFQQSHTHLNEYKMKLKEKTLKKEKLNT